MSSKLFFHNVPEKTHRRGAMPYFAAPSGSANHDTRRRRRALSPAKAWASSMMTRSGRMRWYMSVFCGMDACPWETT